MKLKPVPAAALAEGAGAVEGCAALPAGRSDREATERVSVGTVADARGGFAVAVGRVGCGDAVAGVSARRVTVPLIEKSRSCAGPTASWAAAGGGGAMEIGALSEDAPSS